MKFRKATKKIVAVASAAALASASAFAVPNYPMNFVDNGELSAQVVVGSGAAASDMAAAESIVANLQAMENGGSDMVTINYREAGASGQSVPVRSAGSLHTFGKTLEDVKSSAFFDTDMNILRDTVLRVGSITRDVEQSILMADNGEFEHALRHRLADDISSHIFIDRGLVFTYSVDVQSVAIADFDDVEGEDMTLLGQEFTVISMDSNEVKLVGGANKLALGAGESASVTHEGNQYEVRVRDVSTTQAIVEVNGQTRTLSVGQNREVGGVLVAVTETFSTDRSGYAELVVGGSELLLRHNSVLEVNGEFINDLFDDYRVEVVFKNGEGHDFTGFDLEYYWDGNDGIILRAGDSFEDRVFNAFRVEFEGINDVDYEEIRLDSSAEWITFNANTIRGDSLSENMVYVFEQDNEDFHSFVAGRDDLTVTFLDDFDATDLSAVNLGNGEWAVVENLNAGTGAFGNLVFAGAAADVVRLFELDGTDVAISGGAPLGGLNSQNVEHIKANGAAGVRFLVGDDDTQYLYEISRYRTADDEYSFNDILRGNTRQAISTQVEDRLNDVSFTATTDGNVTEFSNTRTNAGLALANEMMVDFTGAAVVNLSDSNLGTISFSFDTSDITEDNDGNDAGSFDVTFYYDGTDNEIVFRAPTFDGNFVSVPGGARADVSTANSDIRERIDGYGTKVRWDNRDGMFVQIHVPDRQVEAMVNLVAGQAGSTNSVTVPANQAEARVAELEAQGATILGQSTMSGESVTVNVAAPTMDMDLTEADVAAGNHIVVGGPAVNAAARIYLGIDSYDVNNPQDIARAGVTPGQFVHLFFEEANSIVVYGYSAADTTAAVQQLNQGSANFEDR